MSEFVYLLECKDPLWRGRYHHPSGSGTIGRKAAEFAFGVHRAVFIPWYEWSDKAMKVPCRPCT